MDKRFAVIGLARFGTALSRTLSSKGAEVLAIDVDEEKVEALADDVARAVTMDATDLKALRSQNIEDMDAVIIAIGTDFESLLLITVNLMELKVPRIIARAMTETQKKILEKIGVQEIVAPETEVGVNLAERLVTPSIVSYLQLPDRYEIVEVKIPDNCKRRTLKDIDLRRKYNINLIAIKRKEIREVDGKEVAEEHMIGVPHGDLELTPNDTLLIIGQEGDVNRFIEVNR